MNRKLLSRQLFQSNIIKISNIRSTVLVIVINYVFYQRQDVFDTYSSTKTKINVLIKCIRIG